MRLLSGRHHAEGHRGCSRSTSAAFSMTSARRAGARRMGIAQVKRRMDYRDQLTDVLTPERRLRAPQSRPTDRVQPGREKVWHTRTTEEASPSPSPAGRRNYGTGCGRRKRTLLQLRPSPRTRSNRFAETAVFTQVRVHMGRPQIDQIHPRFI